MLTYCLLIKNIIDTSLTRSHVGAYNIGVRIVMKCGQQSTGDTRRATNVSLSAHLLVEARVLEVNVSRAAEQGLVQAIAERRVALWLEESQDSLESSNAFVEQHGLPLAQYREF